MNKIESIIAPHAASNLEVLSVSFENMLLMLFGRK